MLGTYSARGTSVHISDLSPASPSSTYTAPLIPTFRLWNKTSTVPVASSLQSQVPSPSSPCRLPVSSIREGRPPPQEYRSHLIPTRMCYLYTLRLIHTYSPPPHPSVQGATEENPDLERGPPEKLGKEITINKKYNPRKQNFLVCSLLSNNSKYRNFRKFSNMHKNIS